MSEKSDNRMSTNGLNPESCPSSGSMLCGVDPCRPVTSPPSEDHVETSPNEQLGSARLMVSNLDYNISAREWKKILIAEFQQHVQVLGVYMQTQADNTNIGYVKVRTIDEARYAISQFHHKKIGYKRIHVSLINNDNNSTAANTRSEVVVLLKEVTGNCLPLFKFIEMFEKRYHRSISVSELYRMRDTIEIEEHGGAGRMMSLVSSPSPSPKNCDVLDLETECLESPVCKLHCPEGSSGYVSVMDAASLPNVIIQLKTFSAKVHTLLQTHEGSMQLISFQCCYETEFQPLVAVPDGGVPLEHLISCVPGVKVAITRSGVKKIQWAENKPPSTIDVRRSTSSPLMTQQLSQFSREVIDLLKHSPQCRMSFSKFIPAYHHHFGRQCRVADYGYTKLMELFEAIPHIVQIIGGGSRRFVTMSHRAQVKRFSSDLLRVLKSQVSKQISVMDLAIVYNKVIGKPFDIHNYGVCFIEDMLSELPETTVLVTGVGREMTISIPRREQTLEEGERTKQFAVEVVDLLRHSPQCRMPFNKFIPAYHHHFGKQCRVADYGFTKLIELFESIPHILQIEDEADDKMLCLTEQELLRVLEDQVTSLLRSYPNSQLPVPEFLTAFMRFHGHSIRLQDYNVSSVSELIQQIPAFATVERVNGRATIRLVDHSREKQLSLRVLLMLMDEVGATMKARNLITQYESLYSTTLTMEEVLTDLHGIIKVIPDEFGGASGGVVKLCALQMFARDVRSVLLAHDGKLSLQNFETAYAHHFGVALVPASYGYPSLLALLQAIPHLATVRGKGFRRIIMLTPEFQAPSSGHQEAVEQESREESPLSPPTTWTSEGKASTPSSDSGITECHDDLSPAPSFDSPGLLQTPPGYQDCRSPSFHAVTPVRLDMFSHISDGTEEQETSTSDMLHFAAQLLPTSVPHGPYPSQTHYTVPQAFDPFHHIQDQYAPPQYPYMSAGVPLQATFPYSPPQIYHMTYSFCPSNIPAVSCQDVEQGINRFSNDIGQTVTASMDAPCEPIQPRSASKEPQKICMSPTELFKSAEFSGSHMTPPGTLSIPSSPKSLHTLATERIQQSGMSLAMSCDGPTYAEMLCTTTSHCSALYIDPFQVQHQAGLKNTALSVSDGATVKGFRRPQASPKKLRLAARFNVPMVK